MHSLLSILLLSIFSVVVTAKDGPIATLQNGIQYQGKTEEKGDSFRGIRFGEAPIGALRFAPPKPYEYSSEDNASPLDATKLASVCPQKSCTNTGCSEDCLFLNIFTGKNATEQALATGEFLPVAIFVHGGSYNSGAGNLYPGGPLVHYWDGKGIMVTINYRLGALGFAGAEQLRFLDPNGGSTGNMGIQDQRLAFQWVQDNIASFGGDAKKVMIFGESAGAGSMTMHLTMKKSFGSYSRVVLESGAFAQWNMQPMAHAQAYYETFAELANCSADDVACLQALTVDQVMDAYHAVPNDGALGEDPYMCGPTVDGVEATVPAWIAAAKGEVNTVPVMFGTNRDEGSMFCKLNEDATLDDLNAYWTDFDLNLDINTLDKLYTGSDKTYPTEEGRTRDWWAGMRSLGDMAMTCPANYAAGQLSAKQPVYTYFFTHESKYAKKHDGLIIHGSELPYVLHLENVFANIKDRKMSDMMASYWGNFLMSDSGDPNEHKVGMKFLPKWPQFNGDSSTGKILSIDEVDSSNAVQGLKKDECAYWIPFVDASIRSTTW